MFRVIRPFDPWSSPLCTCPRKYTLNPYTGCSHMCLYCYATAYIGRKPSKPKANLFRNIKHDLRRIDFSLPIDLSLSSDPYPPEEKKFGITRKVLEILLPLGLKIQITTKSDLYVRDLDLLSRYNVAVSETITTLDDNLARIIEPNAPRPSRRLRALEKLRDAGVPFSVRIDPIIPFINDDPDELQELVETVVSIGASHIVTSTYKARPDNFKRLTNAFPELKNKLRKLYYPRGPKIGYAYLPKHYRRSLLLPVVKTAHRLGISYATCREGLTDPTFFLAPSCDGTHLIPLRIKAKPPSKLESFLEHKS